MGHTEETIERWGHEMASRNTKSAVGFEKELWDAACALWGHISTVEYRQIIIGLIFLKYISAAFDKRYKELEEEGYGFENDKEAYEEVNVFYVPEKARWEEIATNAHKPEIGKVIDDAMRAIEDDNLVLKDVLPKNFSKPELDKSVLGNVVDLFTNMDMSDTEQSQDLLGRTYEYCIAQFASKEATDDGAFFTPSSIVKTLVAVLEPKPNSRIYDPCMGSGGMFVQSEKFIEDHAGNRNSVSVFGQEAKADIWKMAKINMAIRGIEANFGPHYADSFTNDLHPTLKADYVLANPPFNWKGLKGRLDKDDRRWKYGIPPEKNANFAWMQHMIYHLAPNGRIGLVLANGALSSQTGGEGKIRQAIVEDDLVEGIVALPVQMFYSTQIPVSLWFISKNKKQKNKTLFIDARNMGYMADRTHRDFSDKDIKKIADTFEQFREGKYEDVPGFCAVKTTEEIAKQDFILTPGRYVGIAEQADDGEPFDEKMKRLTSELSELFKKSHELEDEIRKNWEAIGYDI